MTPRRAAVVACLSGMIACAALATPARAESCSTSRQYILENGSGGEGLGSQAYQALSQVCQETLAMSNVKDAFLLVSGAIAVIPRRDGISATATTLSEFCQRFPTKTLRFVDRKEIALTANIGRAVRLDASTATSCQKIVGG